MGITICIANSPEIRHQAYRLRYRVYIQEKGFGQAYADTSTQTIQEPEDRDATIFVALKDNLVVGTLRIQMYPCDFGIYTQLFQMDRYRPYFPSQTSVTTKFVIAPEHRGIAVAYRLITEACRIGFERGIRFDFICCYREMFPFVNKLGYRQVQPEIMHPEYGRVIPMILAWEPKHLAKVKSPLLPIIMQTPGSKEPLNGISRLMQQMQYLPDKASRKG